MEGCYPFTDYDSFPCVLITNSLIMVFLQKIHRRYTSVALTSFCLEITTKINYVKIFVELKINRDAYFRFRSSKLTSKTDTWSSCLGFTSLNVLPTCLLSKASCKQCDFPLKIGSISLETCNVFLWFIVISNPVIFPVIFNFMPITHHNQGMF